MSILSSIIDAILSMLGATRSPQQMADVLDKKAATMGEPLDWRNSIVDLMKVAGMDSSLQAREALAAELGYVGPYNGSAEMNTWLHARVMESLSKHWG
jgi:hypothetical protein